MIKFYFLSLVFLACSTKNGRQNFNNQNSIKQQQDLQDKESYNTKDIQDDLCNSRYIWFLSEYKDKGVLKEAVAASSLYFSEDGKVKGSTGVNNLNGLYSISGNTVEITHVVSTKMAAVGQNGRDRNKQEEIVLKVLNGPFTFIPKARRFTLKSQDGLYEATYVQKLPRCGGVDPNQLRSVGKLQVTPGQDDAQACE